MSNVTEEAWHHEYYQLQTIVTGYNSDCLAIKNWSVTAAAVAVGYAYTANHPELLYVSAAGAAAFLLTEAYWRANQLVFFERIREIEEARQAAAAAARLVPPQPIPELSSAGRASPDISNSWLRHWDVSTNLGHVLKAASMMRTWLPHGLIIVAAVVLLICAPPKEGPSEHDNQHGTTVYQQSSTAAPEAAPLTSTPGVQPAGH